MVVAMHAVVHHVAVSTGILVSGELFPGRRINRSDSGSSFRSHASMTANRLVSCSRSFAELIELHTRSCSSIHWMMPTVGNQDLNCSNSRLSDHNWNFGLTAIRDRRLQSRQS